MNVRELRVRARRYLATLGVAAAGYSAQTAILPMSLDYFLKPANVETIVAKECPNAKRTTMALRAERNQRVKKEPRGIMRWLL